jgi:putative MFS transporter
MSTERTMLQAMDEGRLKPRYWILFGLLVINTIVEFFDFFIVGFLISVIGPQWHLSIGETSAILLAGGLGQVLGSMPMAWLADRYGRRPLLLLGTCLYASAAGLIALVPDGNWQLVVLLRFLVGWGYSAVISAQLALLVEFSPTRYRTVIAGSAGAFAPLGVLLASGSVGLLLPFLGWRWLAAMGAAPILLAVLLYLVLPESVRWLIARGKMDEAQRTLHRYVELPSGVLAIDVPEASPPRVSIADLYRNPQRFWVVVFLSAGLAMGGHAALAWGPVFLSLILAISPVEAARWFVWIGLSGLAGRVLFTFLPAVIGRWASALICCWSATVLLAIAGLFPTTAIGPLSVFFLCLLVGEVFYNGGFTNILPYASELFPVPQAAQGAALSLMASGLAKLGGPLIVGLVAGSREALSRETALAAVAPAFLALAGFSFIAALVLLRYRFETHNVRMSLDLD